MSDTDQLRDLGQRLADALAASYGMTAPGARLVFLPGGVSAPADIVQSGVLNPTQLQTWLSINFDSPFVIAGAEGAILEKDPSHGPVSRIYTIAASSAQPLGDPDDDAWKRVDAEIADARRALGPPEAQKPIVCEPDDWPLPAANAGYWTVFDSSETESTSTEVTTPARPARPQFWIPLSSAAAAAPVPVVDPQFWRVRSLAAEPVTTPDPPTPSPDALLASEEHAVSFARTSPAASRSRFASPTAFASPLNRSLGAMSALQASSIEAMEPVASETVQASAATSQVALDKAAWLAARPDLHAWRIAAESGELPARLKTRALFQNAQAIDTVTTSASSTVTVHLEHQCVALGYYRAGQPWWDGVFLADQGWYVPGMKRGALLPAPDGEGGLAFGLPVAMVIVQKLRVSGQWSAAATAALGSPGGTLGPLSLFGAVATHESDGVTITYGHEGMQVVALLCGALPVLPPADAPEIHADTGASPVPVSPPADAPPDPAPTT
nr:hypothetical protein [Caulobacteraceae bacterium]